MNDDKKYQIGWRAGGAIGEECVVAQSAWIAARMVRERLAKQLGMHAKFVEIAYVSILERLNR